MPETNAKRRDPSPRRVRPAAPPASAAASRGAAGDPIPGADGTAAAAGHLPAEVMANLMIAPGGSDELTALRHLLSVCPTCRGQHENLKAKSRELRHWNLAAVLVEADEAPGLWNQIAALPYHRQLAAVRAEPSYQTWGFALWVLRLSGTSSAAEPRRAAQLANLGLAVADTLAPAYDQDWIEDLAALALARLGDARREMGELAAANDAFDQARERRAAGTEGPSIEAEILSLEALLRRDERRLEDAIGLLGRVHEIRTERDETEEDAYMELASLLLDDSENVRPLGNELLPVWSCAGIDRYESAALILFQQACEERKLTPDLVRQLAAFLERRRRPSLAWWSAWDAVLHEEESPRPPEAPQAGAEPQSGP
jgi:hypothetical protein